MATQISSEAPDNESFVFSNQSHPTGISLAFSPYITALYILIYAPVWFGIIFGNVLVVAAFVYHRPLRRLQNYLLVSLAVTDILTGAIALPLWVTARLVVSPPTCFASARFNFFIPSLTFCGSSIYHLLAIAVERCLSLLWPFKFQQRVRHRHIIFVIGVIWAYNIAFACLPLYIPSPETDQWVCTAVDAYENEVDEIFLAIACTLPLYVLFMSILYAVMLRVAFRHIEKRRELSNQVDSAFRDAQARRRGIKTMAVVVGAFGVCWIPTSLKLSYEAFAPTNKKKLITVETFAEYLSFVNSMVNPLIYAYFNNEFKIGFKKVLAKWGCSKGTNAEAVSGNLHGAVNKTATLSVSSGLTQGGSLDSGEVAAP